jgi:hypothetical protein
MNDTTGDGAQANPARTLFEEFVDRLRDKPTCPHLTARPRQPRFINLLIQTWQCRACMERTRTVWCEMGGPDLCSPAEDHTCDRCRRWYLAPVLYGVVMAHDGMIITVCLCPRCLKLYRRGEDAA